jgi:hypothetical protein
MGLRRALRAFLEPAFVTWMWLKVGGDRLVLLRINFEMFALNKSVLRFNGKFSSVYTHDSLERECQQIL